MHCNSSATTANLSVGNGVSTAFAYNGIIQNNVKLSMTGTGNIDIGNRNIDFRLVPKAAVRGASFGIPFRVKGSWDRVHYAPDLTGMMNGLLQNLENGKAPFKGLFDGSGHKPDQDNGQKKKKKNLGDTLKNMFGIH